MNIPFFFLADRGGLKVFRATGAHTKIPELVEFFRVDDTRGKMESQLTDRAGGFPTGGTNGHGNSAAERTRLRAENEMRSFRKITARMAETLRMLPTQKWAFAAPAEMNRAILAGLSPAVKAHLAQNVQADLMNTPVQSLLTHFASEPLPVA